jgi:glutamate 5-kinase
LSLGVIPIINENDTISVSEILHINKFGDNDTLSAIAAGMCGADYLFLLTDVDSLYSDNPRRVETAKRVKKVRDIDQVRKLVSTNTLGSSLGTGGMETKLIAAELATAVGCHTVITLGSVPTRILEIVQSHDNVHNDDDVQTGTSSRGGEGLPGVEFATSTTEGEEEGGGGPRHTLFFAKPTPLSSRRFWILHGLTPRGTVYIDYGAYQAISRGERDGGGGGNGGRLLAAGVLRVEGNFAAGQAVRVCVVRNKSGRRNRRTTGQQEEEGQGGKDDRRRRRERAKSPDHWQDRREEREKEQETSARLLTGSIEGLDVRDGHEDDRNNEEEEQEAEDVFEFGRGLTNYNSVEIDRVKGLRSYVAFPFPSPFPLPVWIHSTDTETHSFKLGRSDIERVLGYYEAEHVVESVVELRGGTGGSAGTATTGTK